MKKIFMFALALFVCNSIVAQVKYETAPLSELLAKAKAENKLVMIMGSSTT